MKAICIDRWGDRSVMRIGDLPVPTPGERQVLVAMKAASINPVDSKTLEVHHALRAGGVAILEGLALAEVPAGEYELIALPLNWRGVDAAPVRAVLRQI